MALMSGRGEELYDTMRREAVALGLADPGPWLHCNWTTREVWGNMAQRVADEERKEHAARERLEEMVRQLREEIVALDVAIRNLVRHFGDARPERRLL